ncbi:UDP-N-acetyl-D-galactosamine dehydrogenase [Methylohalomonas lacus]|uniref:UDP-N-acetyl-D-galactosamine dehydrogenase n=1 Tax=Methylohalomonas lacus TaxID=398773 RepID=A0AAE3L210_9GAMM|nr:nucleotide sugar dehydrogenase [Methylohalomonas lacus]MCS3904345.1 UDP-N-acetyl-D-galactosamine dehydrogenase [Methylohalomonas lacus]
MAHERLISVIGLGYVGLPVAVAFGRQHKVIGFDINESRIAELQSGHDSTLEIEAAEFARTDIRFTSNPVELKQADFHIVAVPTPIDAAKRPDLGPLLAASRILGKQIKTGDIVVYESTVYPGATEEDCIPILEQESGLHAGMNFFVGYSPERINPGDRQHRFTSIKKVVSAQTQESLETVAAVYESVVDAGIHKAPSIKVAEAAKVIENTQRDLNIALMNELVLIFSRLGIDTHDVLEAAGTKWNFLPFRPGLVGGHCIGVDPYYLTHKAAIMGYSPQVILSGRGINDGMGNYIASCLIKTLIAHDNRVKGATVTILGLTFKEDVPDLRNTRVIDVVRELQSFGVNVQVHDPLADPEGAEHEYGIRLLKDRDLQPAAAVILAVPHVEYVSQGWKAISKYLEEGQGIVYDIKAKLDRTTIPSGITLMRL